MRCLFFCVSSLSLYSFTASRWCNSYSTSNLRTSLLQDLYGIEMIYTNTIYYSPILLNIAVFEILLQFSRGNLILSASFRVWDLVDISADNSSVYKGVNDITENQRQNDFRGSTQSLNIVSTVYT